VQAVACYLLRAATGRSLRRLRLAPAVTSPAPHPARPAVPPARYGPQVSVPLYDTLGPDAVEYIANHAELAAVGVAAAVLPTLLNVLPRCRGLRLVVRAQRRGLCNGSCGWLGGAWRAATKRGRLRVPRGGAG
jgi:hypothetical protein